MPGAVNNSLDSCNSCSRYFFVVLPQKYYLTRYIISYYGIYSLFYDVKYIFLDVKLIFLDVKYKFHVVK